MEFEKVNWLFSCRISGFRRSVKSAKSANGPFGAKIDQKHSQDFRNSAAGLGLHCAARERFFFSEPRPKFVPFTFWSSCFIRKQSSGLCRRNHGFADFRRFSWFSQIFADFRRFLQILADLSPCLRCLQWTSLMSCLCVFLGCFYLEFEKYCR